MSNAIDEVSSPNTVMARAAIRRSISASASMSTACMASQNRRWSNAAAATGTRRSPAVPAHQSAKASLEQGATTRFIAANAR